MTDPAMSEQSLAAARAMVDEINRVVEWTDEDAEPNCVVMIAAALDAKDAEIARLTGERDEAYELPADFAGLTIEEVAQRAINAADDTEGTERDVVNAIVPCLRAMKNYARTQEARDALLRAETAERALDEARAALKPFADYALKIPDGNDGGVFFLPCREPGHLDLTVGDFRAAARAMGEG